MHLKEEISGLNQNLTIRNNEAMHLKDNSQLLQEKINGLELKNEQLREELKNSNFELGNTRT
jgi:regulator of replication initiation timing